MQEPQYRAAGVRELLDAVARAKVPCMSIMNMPPPPFLARIPGLDVARAARATPTRPSGTASIRSCMTLCSPDAQAFRPPDEKVNVLQVRLPTNFKAARFDPTSTRRCCDRLEADIDAARLDYRDRARSRFPSSCACTNRSTSAREVGDAARRQLSLRRHRQRAQHPRRGLERRRSLALGYEWVIGVCVALAANRSELVSVREVAKRRRNAAEPLRQRGAPSRPECLTSSDRPLVQAIAAQKGMRHEIGRPHRHAWSTAGSNGTGAKQPDAAPLVRTSVAGRCARAGTERDGAPVRIG
jgi:hypothetical protein